MNIISIARGQDTAGQGYALKRALGRHHPEVGFRSAISSETYISYPVDILWDGRLPVLEKLIAAADVVHLHNGVSALRRIDPGRRKAVLTHHHGTAFRRQPAAYLADDRRHRAITAVSTIDLTRYHPSIQWFPQTVDEPALHELAARYRRHPDGRIRIGHAPTSRPVKSTDRFLAAVQSLQRRYPQLELELIERRPHDECLRRKAACDIYYDQVELGYGNNAIEAWTMGIPVVAGADAWTLAAMRERFGELPFYRATEETLEARLEELICDAGLRGHYADLGQRHAARWHYERPSSDRAVELFELAMGYARLG